MVLHWVWGPTHRRAIKVGKEAESFSGDPRHIVTIILCEKHYFDA